MIPDLKILYKVEELKNKIDINDYEGFVYLIIFKDTNKKYIGKKQFFSVTNVKLGKKEFSQLPSTRGRKPTKKKVIKESNWMNYYSSSKEVSQLCLQNLENVERYVLKLCKTKKEMSYWENAFLFKMDVLFNDEYLNDNIEGKYFKTEEWKQTLGY